MSKKPLLIILFILNVGVLAAQDWVPVIENFSYNASRCRLAFSCFVKNIDKNSDAEATTYKIIIFNTADDSEVFNTDVTLDELKIGASSPTKSWTIDLPALSGYSPNESYKMAVIANTRGKFEFDKKNNRVESPQFACGSPSLNNAPSVKKENDTDKKAKKEVEKEDDGENLKLLSADEYKKILEARDAARERRAKAKEEKKLDKEEKKLDKEAKKAKEEEDKQNKKVKEEEDKQNKKIKDLEIEKLQVESVLSKMNEKTAKLEEKLAKETSDKAINKLKWNIRISQLETELQKINLEEIEDKLKLQGADLSKDQNKIYKEKRSDIEKDLKWAKVKEKLNLAYKLKD
jgi:hypothetical protein